MSPPLRRTPRLSSGQRKYLRGLAHPLQASVLVGKEGITENLVASADANLECHELIKVKFVASKEEKEALIEELAGVLGAALAGLIGHVAILYRPCREEDKRRVVLPEG
ncbi:MAG: YhbY family RNA-binding protein [Magnetococcales bacterium]|nr:YhbY family RNA-binding protein [Magnetococcales bacterium]